MNTNNGEGNTEIPKVEDFVIDDSWDVDTIKEKTTEHNQKVKDWQTKTDENNKQLFARTKKAEGFVPDGKGGWVKPTKKTKEDDEGGETTELNPIDSLKPSDMFVLTEAKVAQEDIGDVVEYATMKKISVAEALKSSVVQTILAEKVEKRKVAEGTHTGGNQRGSAGSTDASILSDSHKGILPESDEDMRRLALLRKGKKK